MNYQLHDYVIDAVTIDRNKIIFSFPDGFYAGDQQSKPKKLVFHIDRGYCQELSAEAFLFIRRKCFFGWRDISFQQFIALFKKGNMLIFDEYDSRTTNGKMLQLNANTRWSNIEMFIMDIEDIQFLD